MKKIFVILLLIFTLVSCENVENDEIEVEEYTYESHYVKGYNFPIDVMNRVYYSYHDIFAGFYLIDGGYNLNITEGAPQTLLDELEQNSSVTYHIVEFSFAELWTVQEIVLVTIINVDGFSGLGVSEMDNTVKLTLKPDTVVPESFSHYIEIGILTIDFIDLIVTF